jgi:ribonuclease HII
MAKFLDFSKDIELLNEHNADVIIGIDEVGRGAWAGPVCVGAFVLDINNHQFVEGVNDSKLVKKVAREELSPILSRDKHLVVSGELESINNLGIGKTITNLILSIVKELELYVLSINKKPVFIIDGQFRVSFGDNSVKRIKADSTFYSVAAASILAKVYRDNLMNSLHSSYNLYAFDRNKGYPTAEHLKALEIYGVSAIHRKSFKPISNQLSLLNEN